MLERIQSTRNMLGGMQKLYSPIGNQFDNFL